MKLPVECPTDFVSVNENKVRLIALQVFGGSALLLATGWFVLGAVLVADFFLRSFHLQKWSPLGKAADGLIAVFNIGIKPTDQAPKRFAARIGLAFASLIFLAGIAQAEWVAFSLTTVLLVFSFLESVFGFCAGCCVYVLGKKATLIKS